MRLESRTLSILISFERIWAHPIQNLKVVVGVIQNVYELCLLEIFLLLFQSRKEDPYMMQSSFT